MAVIARRPSVVVDRALELLAAHGRFSNPVRILLLGVSYKPGVADIRESPALEIIARLEARGAVVDYFDPKVPAIHTAEITKRSLEQAQGSDYDLVIAHTAHKEIDFTRFANSRIVLDATYRLPPASNVFML